MKIKKHSFLWKLTENYLNAIMVLVLVILVMQGMFYEDNLSLFLAVLWVLIIPFLGTFIDLKSNAKR